MPEGQATPKGSVEAWRTAAKMNPLASSTILVCCVQILHYSQVGSDIYRTLEEQATQKGALKRGAAPYPYA